MTTADLDALAAAYLAGDDPMPGPDESFVGDGDYRAIGAEFLKHFVQLGGLRPDETVFEIGCGHRPHGPASPTLPERTGPISRHGRGERGHRLVPDLDRGAG